MNNKLKRLKELYSYLQKISISVATISHPEVISCEESKSYYDALGYEEKQYGLCKNIFIRDKKGKNFWLIIIDHNKMIDMVELKEVLHSTRKIGFATSQNLENILGVEAGAVSLFSIFNDKEKRVKVIIDECLIDKDILAFHPNYRGLTSFISSQDAIKFLDSMSCTYSVLAVPSIEKIVYSNIEKTTCRTLSHHI
jgi:Ala-tRNA(Pro) deacylase